VATVTDSNPQRLMLRICGEFREMPGLCLTRAQAQRLWGLDASTCRAVLRTLVDSGFLRMTTNGMYVSAETEVVR